MSFPFVEPQKHVRQARAMRALAHPVRLRLLSLLVREEQLTSTRASGLTGETVANCSFHLRQLAKYGFVEETQGGDRREHPWRLARTNPLTALPPTLFPPAREIGDELRRRELFARQLRIFDPDTLAPAA
jgi:DNA-binding transcriptional ArsR family regulator